MRSIFIFSAGVVLTLGLSCGKIDEPISGESVVEQHAIFDESKIILDQREANLEKQEGLSPETEAIGVVKLIVKADKSIALQTNSYFDSGKLDSKFDTKTSMYLTEYSYTLKGNSIKVPLSSITGKQELILTDTYPALTIDDYQYVVIYDEDYLTITAAGEFF